MSKIRISEIEDAFKEIFNEDSVKSVDTVYETPDNGDFYKLIISIHGLTSEDINIVHTKFIFKTDLNKRYLIEDSFIYLYDINCVYHKIEFGDISDMKKKIEDIIISNNFGEDLQIISDFTETPSMFLNYYMKRAKIIEYSIFDVIYDPKFKTTPCHKMTFDFKININDNYNMEVSIRKIDRDEENKDIYKFQFKFLDDIETIETGTLKNIHFFIGSNIAKILDKKIKSN